MGGAKRFQGLTATLAVNLVLEISLDIEYSVL
ncbi:hypothetical protein SBA5_290092 [Candidatus Sulfotelmatomonas gaucii]|uniref:Uncharacterized protein n=1 Tax=Candidatus Sulfuritelmatomonas gaucii TaxID=2043161 RepID=A0A2N9LAE8_9BACT|nr:hypothetical protein SBA5_290092 [Candidatus Sulfotelmatomonas gaucii]